MQRNIKHFASPSFWACYEKLPKEVQELANRNFELLKTNPKHPSLYFKKVKNYYSARVGKKYRTIGIEIEEGIVWFWIGTHSEYDKLRS
jgi:mRNA-degrading endonuclease RelE of RelBE toxin-antitoxin system